MDGPMPDPSTLDDGSGVDNDDVPLSVVKEEIKRSASQRNGSLPQQQQRRQQVDLFGDLEESAPVPARPSTTEPAVSRAPAPVKAPAAPPKQTKPGDSLLGLDFFGGPQTAQPARPSSTGGSTPGATGRADLKSSILSLYASKPAAPPQQPQQAQPQSNMNAFGGMQSPPLASPTQQASSFGGMNDAFGSLSFGQSPPAQQAKPSPFAGLTSPTGHSRQASSTSKPALSGGSFFDMKPTPPAKPMSPPSQPAAAPVPVPRKESFRGDWGDFSSAAASPPAPVSTIKSPPAASSSMGDLFDMSSPIQKSAPAPAPAPPPKPAAQPPPINYSAFNLSQPASQPAKPAQPVQSSTSAFGALNNMDAWGSNDAWATPDPAPAPQPPPKQTTAPSFQPSQPPHVQTSAFDSGWGDVASSSSASRPAANTSSGFSVQQDDDFGGWSHASPVATTPGTKTSGEGGTGSGTGGGLGGSGADLFDNPW